MTLRIFSEPYAPSGSMSASGVGRLLGAPRSDRLQVAIRESIQNSWDARTDDESSEWRMRLFRPTGRQVRALSELVFAERSPRADPERNAVADCLESESFCLLEIADFGTRGLGGPVRSDVVPVAGTPTDYVDFVLNVGRQRDRDLGGGTYGYGKSSFFALSDCSTIVMHSVTRGDSGRNEHRLIASRLGQNFDVGRGRQGGRYTGRHWWGERDVERNVVLPLRGAEAGRVAHLVGFTDRRLEDTGTSIMVLAPVLPTPDDDNPMPLGDEELAAHIAGSVLWNAWPKLVPVGMRRRAPMRIAASLYGEPVRIPAPDTLHPYDKFADALRAIRAGGEVDIRRYTELLGRLALRRWPRAIAGGREAAARMVPEPLHHVVLMRPAELVVTALECTQHLDPGVDWAGVFVCSDDREIEKSFAESEPPAHDDWEPDNLKQKTQRSRVAVALRRIREEARSFAAPPAEPPRVGQGSLAPAAAVLGRDLMGIAGTGPGVPPKGPPPGKGRPPRADRISRPVFTRLEDARGTVRARFESTVEIVSAGGRSVTATPFVVTDSGPETAAPNGRRPEIVGWVIGDDDAIVENPVLAIRSPGVHRVQAVVTVPDFVAVSLAMSFAES